MNTRRLILSGGCGLAFGAAFANTGLVLHTGTSVSHLTGDVARMTINLARWSPSMVGDLLRVGVAAGLFLFGAILAGFVIHHPNIDLTRPYGRTITSIGSLLLASYFNIERHPIVSIGLAAFACGLQNALATHYRGLILRTTHLTGLMTDLGVVVGMRIRGHSVPAWKIRVPAMLMLSFFLGGLVAAYIHFSGYDSILIAGLGYIFAGVGWTIWKHFFRISLKSS
jgi:uncharacterized membrane protein YoaK (UPF0700 family)